MWAFVAVAGAIMLPGVRAALEGLFADLSIVFMNHLHVVIAATIACFCLAVVREMQRQHHQYPTENKLHLAPQSPRFDAMPRARRPSQGVQLRGKTLSWASSLLLASSFVPATLASVTTAKVPFTLADNVSALASLTAEEVTCNYAKTKECIDNPHDHNEFEKYVRGEGHCVVFDSAYVNVSSTVAALPSRYMPMQVEAAYQRGFANKYSEWSPENRQQFQSDCSILYNQTVAKGQDYLCCTEAQYEQLHMQVRMIPGLCSSCTDNLRNIWCQSACNPSNSMFFDVNQVRLMPGDDGHPKTVFPAVEEATYYVSRDWIRDIYDYCKDDSTVFSMLCNTNLNCTDGFGILNFMGEYKFNSIGSPFKTTFKTMDMYPEDKQKEMFCTCGNSTDCYHPIDVPLKSCAGVCGSLCAVSANEKRSHTDGCLGAVTTYTGQSANDPSAASNKWSAFSKHLADNVRRTDFKLLNYALAIVGALLVLAMICGFLFFSYRRRKAAASGYASASVAPSAGGVQTEAHLSWFDDRMTKLLQNWGRFIATGRHPWVVLTTALICIVVASSGMTQIQIETDPVKLWVAESSRSFKERDRYGELFMPFYRTEQVIMVPKDGGTIGRKEYLREAIRVQEIMTGVVYGPPKASYPERITLQDICWKATGTECTINAITQYFQNRLDHFDFYDKYGLAMQHFRTCLFSPANADIDTCTTLSKILKPGDSIPQSMGDCPCLSAFGSPMNLYNVYLGGFPEGVKDNTSLYLESKALLSTSLVYNYYTRQDNMPAIHWEREFVKEGERQTAESTMFDITYSGEISIQDEITKESNGNILPVALSYSLMIIYVSLGINRWTKDKSFFHTSKMLVGFLGILCILLAVMSTIGLFMYAGASLQLVIMEVVPFLTLAIGVDNIFLLVHAMSKSEHELRVEQPDLFASLPHSGVEEAAKAVVSRGLGYIGPSIFMASLAEAVAFSFGCISPMPAVLWFAAFSAVAVFLNYCLQMTLLLSIITLDKRRELSGKYDILLCFKPVPQQEAVITSPNVAANPTTPNVETTPGTESTPAPPKEQWGSQLFDRFVEKYAALLAKPLIKLGVLLVFLLLLLGSIVSSENVKHGLRQADSLSSKSYLIPYFQMIDDYLATGAPVYFVVEGGYGRNPKSFDLTDQKVEAKFCKSKDFCDEYSIPNIINALANEMDGKTTHISTGTMYSWMDDFWGFVNPNNECCRTETNNSYLPIIASNSSYSAIRKMKPACMTSTPPPVPADSFMSLFSIFSTASAGALCSYGGGSIYRGQFSIDNKPVPVTKETDPQIVVNRTSYGSAVTAFSYMTTSRANPLQQDYIDGYKQARRAAEWISEKTGIDVWAYSLTYVFFDQYLTVVNDTYKFVGLALLAVFVIHAVYFGAFWYPLAVTLGATNIVMLILGFMGGNEIMLNGLSMVNLVIAAGISVEFCGHYVRMFAKARGSGDARAKEALRKVMSSVLFGITITKVVGLSALTLADSRIFYKYYFMMYMAVVVCGLLNGMVLMPVALSTVIDVHQFFTSSRKEDPKALGAQQEGIVEGDNAVSPVAAEYVAVPPTAGQSPSSQGTGPSNSD